MAKKWMAQHSRPLGKHLEAVVAEEKRLEATISEMKQRHEQSFSTLFSPFSHILISSPHQLLHLCDVAIDFLLPLLCCIVFVVSCCFCYCLMLLLFSLV